MFLQTRRELQPEITLAVDCLSDANLVLLAQRQEAVVLRNSATQLRFADMGSHLAAPTMCSRCVDILLTWTMQESHVLLNKFLEPACDLTLRLSEIHQPGKTEVVNSNRKLSP